MLLSIDTTFPKTICLEERNMATTMDDILHPGLHKNQDPAFPHALRGWARQAGEDQAKEESLELGNDHWELVKALQEF